MKRALIGVTESGTALAQRLVRQLGGEVFSTRPYNGAVHLKDGMLPGVARLFCEYDEWVFVCSAGIAVRAIAPHICSKLTDPAVVVVDEFARHAISLLSGHLGGANALCHAVASACGAQAVITTATDLAGRLAPDEMARQNGFAVENPQRIKRLNTASLEGEPITLVTDYKVVVSSRRFELDDRTLDLTPKSLVVGVGCRRGTSCVTIAQAVDAALGSLNLKKSAVAALASIDLKANEPGLLEYCRQNRFEFFSFSAQQLQAFQSGAEQSVFVCKTTGVGNVCQAAATAAAGRGCTLLLPKTVYGGVTISICEKEVTVKVT